MNTVHIDQFDAVAFDLDGTLANTIPVHLATRPQAFAQHGFEYITEAQHELGPTYGSSSEVILGGILHAAGAIDNTMPFGENPIVSEVIATKLRLYQAAALEGFEPMPGAVKFVNLMATHRAGRMAIVTASEEEFIRPFLTHADLHDHFPDELLIGHETIAVNRLMPKPSPDPYLLAAERMNAQHMLVFEDTVPGVTAAKRASAVVATTVIALAHDKPSAKQFRSENLDFPPDAIVDSWDEAAELLGIAP